MKSEAVLKWKEQKKNRFALNNFRNRSKQLQPTFILKYKKKNTQRVSQHTFYNKIFWMKLMCSRNNY